MTFGPAVFRHHVLALDEAGVAQSPVSWPTDQVAQVRGRRERLEPADHRQRLLLRAGGEWPPNHRAAENSDEFAPPHARLLDPMASKQYSSTEPSPIIRWANGGFPPMADLPCAAVGGRLWGIFTHTPDRQ